MSGVMLALKHCIIPRIIDRHQFEEGFDIDKYYGFAAQVLYHCVLCTCFAATICITSLDDTLYHLATLAEPAYCTIDVLLLLFTGTSFTHWQLKPLLVHHTISCACCHALMYGIPSSIYGKMLQFVFHFSSAICLGIANALQTPSLKLSVLQRLWMQVLSMMFWAITRVGLVFILGICVLIDAKRRLCKRGALFKDSSCCIQTSCAGTKCSVHRFLCICRHEDPDYHQSFTGSNAGVPTTSFTD